MNYQLEYLDRLVQPLALLARHDAPEVRLTERTEELHANQNISKIGPATTEL